MGDNPSPPAIMHPPPSPTRSTMPMLYYGLVVVGTAAVVLALYNLIIVRWCADFSDHRARQRSGRPGPAQFHHLKKLSSFKYKREGEGEGDESESECAVCLSAFEDGEELRQLPKCKHSFHVPCIDMWLYTHMDCPLCRCAVEPPGGQLPPLAEEQAENSRQGLYPVTLV